MWKKLGTKILFKHPRITLVEDKIKLQNGNIVPYLRFIENNIASVTIICFQDDLVLVQSEYSYPTGEILYQFPGGKVEKNENIKKAAKREILEESGINIKHISEIGWYYVNNRRSDLKMHVFLSQDFTFCKKKGGDEEEDISSEWLSIAKIDKLITNGKIVNFSFLAAWSLFKNRK